MQATKEHLSLEINKLLKDCGIESKYVYVILNRTRKGTQYEETKICERGMEWKFFKIKEVFPAFTWGEILWEYAEEFFGGATTKMQCPFPQFSKEALDFWKKDYDDRQVIPQELILLFLLQQKKYDEADLYFRENCILIKK